MENKVEVKATEHGYSLFINGIDFSKGTTSFAIVAEGNVAKIQLESDLGYFLNNIKNTPVAETTDAIRLNFNLDDDAINLLNQVKTRQFGQ